MPENTQTLACDLAALPPGGRRRLKELSEKLFRSVDELREMPEGFDLGFSEGSGQTIEELAEFIALDRLCCPFIRHGLIHEPYERGVWLHLSGATGVKDIIKSDLLGMVRGRVAAELAPFGEHDPDTT